MKLIHISHAVLTLMIALMVSPVLAQDECNLRWFENFSDELHSDLIDCPTGITLESEFWRNLQGDDIDWIGKIPGSSFTGPFVPAFAVDGTHIRLEGEGCCNATGVLESDTLDLSGFEVATLSFRRLKPGNTSFLSCSVSSDGGASWNSIWNESSSASLLWGVIELDITSLVGHEEVLIRFNGITGNGLFPDLALDNIHILASPPPLTFMDEGTMTHTDLMDYCLIELGYTKTEAPCAVELQNAELLVDLNLGAQYRYGGTDVDSVIVDFVINGLSLSAPAAPVTTDTIQLHISDDRHPEQLYVHEFTEDYDDIDLFEMIILHYDSGEHQYQQLIDDINFDFEVDLDYGIGAFDLSDPAAIIVNPTSTTTPNSSEVNRMEFEWSSQCPVPLYRFQLLRLHDNTAPNDGCTHTTVEEKDWHQSALTLEVPSTELDLTIIEGSGHYLWRVQPIGSLHDGGESNGMNWGNYSEPLSGTTVHLCGDPSPADQFLFEDPMEGLNRTYNRSYSRNLLQDGTQEFLQKEGVVYHTEALFPQQSLTRHDGIGSVLAQPRNRDFYEREPLTFMAYPADTTDLNLTYVAGIITNSDGDMYSAHDFDAGTGPAAASGKLSTFFSDDNTDLSIPSAGGYPFTGVQYTQDGSNRTTASGREGEVLRLGGDHQQRVYYGSVEQQELTRLFGHEAPDASTVEKIISVSPDNITTQAYIDQFGRTIATNYIKNIAVDTTKYKPIGDGEFVVTGSIGSIVDPDSTTWSAVTRKPFPTPPAANISLDYTLNPTRFSAYCEEYCGTCDYSVRITIVDEADPTNPVYDNTVIMEGQEWVQCAADISSFEAISVVLDTSYSAPSSYIISKVLQRNIPDGGSSYLDHHLDTIQAAVEADVDAVTDTLLAMLADIDAEGVTTVEDFYSYCIDNGEAQQNEEGDTTHFEFLTGVCDTLTVDYYRCGYDCGEGARDFEAFFNEIALNTFLDLFDADVEYISMEDYPLSRELALYWSEWNITYSTIDGAYVMNDNIIANSFGVGDGEFNLIMENMIQDAEDDPDVYGSYTCENIYGALNHIASHYVYQYETDRVMRDLIDILGAQYQDYKISSGTLLPAGSTYSDADLGWLTHPHRYVKITSYPNTCITLIEDQGYDDLDWNNEEHRETITRLLIDLDRCLNDPSFEETADNLGFPTDDQNLYLMIQDYCLDATRELEELFQDEVDAALSEVSFSGIFDFLEQEACMLENLRAHARSLCPDAPAKPSRIHPYPLIPASSSSSPQLIWDCAAGTCPPLNPGSFYEVVAEGIETGHYVTYGGQDYGPNTARSAYFQAADDPDFILRRSSPGVEIWEVTAEYNVLDSLDIAGLQDILTGYPKVCLEGCDSTYTDLSSPATIEGPVLLNTDWESFIYTAGGTTKKWTVGANDWIHAHPPAPVATGPFNDHSDPAFLTNEFDEFANHAVRLETGYNPTPSYGVSTYDPRMEGNGIYTEARLQFSNAPGVSYRLEYDYNIADSVALDNLYFVLTNEQGPASKGWMHLGNGPWLYADEGPVSHWSGSAEVLYPVVDGIIISHESGPAMNGGARFTHFEQDFASPCFGEAAPCEFNLYAFGRQDESSDSTRFLLDNIRIVRLDSISTCDTLYVRYDHATPSSDTLELPTCEQRLARDIVEALNNQSTTIVDTHLDAAERSYFQNCVPNEEFNVGFPLNQYQYSLRQYDAGKRLVRTVSPNGVIPDDNYTDETIVDYAFKSQYANNIYGTPIEFHHSDSAENTRHFYDQSGNKRFVFNPLFPNEITFTCYDKQNREIRSGNIEKSIEDVIEYLDYSTWPECSHPDVSFCTTTVYDVALQADKENHLLNRISHQYNQDADTISYKYDAQGSIVAEYHAYLNKYSDTIQYTLDPATGKKLAVSIITDAGDTFEEFYSYNSDGTTVSSQTTTDTRILFDDARAHFNKLNQISELHLGQYENYKTQFQHNIHQNLDATSILFNPINWEPIATNQYHYYTGAHRAEPWIQLDYYTNPSNFYDGQLSQFSISTGGLVDTLISPSTNFIYCYDEANRLKETLLALDNNPAMSLADYDYDSNGNLTTLVRMYTDGTTRDNLLYSYNSNANTINQIINTVEEANSVPSQDPDNFDYYNDGSLASDLAGEIESIEYRAAGRPHEIIKTDGTHIQFSYDPRLNLRAEIRPISGDTTVLTRTSQNLLASYALDNGQRLATKYHGQFGTISPPDSIGSSHEEHVYTRTLGEHEYYFRDNKDNIQSILSDYTIAKDTSLNDTVDIMLPRILADYRYYPYGLKIDSLCSSIPHEEEAFIADTVLSLGFGSKPQLKTIASNRTTYNFGARLLDVSLGRWHCPDALQAKYPFISPYASMASNPVNVIDPTGEMGTSPLAILLINEFVVKPLDEGYDVAASGPKVEISTSAQVKAGPFTSGVTHPQASITIAQGNRDGFKIADGTLLPDKVEVFSTAEIGVSKQWFEGKTKPSTGITPASMTWEIPKPNLNEYSEILESYGNLTIEAGGAGKAFLGGKVRGQVKFEKKGNKYYMTVVPVSLSVGVKAETSVKAYVKVKTKVEVYQVAQAQFLLNEAHVKTGADIAGWTWDMVSNAELYQDVMTPYDELMWEISSGFRNLEQGIMNGHVPGFTH